MKPVEKFRGENGRHLKCDNNIWPNTAFDSKEIE